MIFLADDYMSKYSDTLGYLISRAIYEKYSLFYIERTLSYSKVISEFEKSDITLIAFSSFEKIYEETFPHHDNEFHYNPYDMYGWIGNIYIHLFLDLSITFEALFYVIPIEEMLGLYHLYHEMDYSQIKDFIKGNIPYSILDVIMKRVRMTTHYLSEVTGISFSTLNALRYGKRNINKVEASILLKIANALSVKMESLLTDINLNKVL